MSLSPVISAVFLLPFLHHYIDKIEVKEVQPFYDFKNIVGLFIPTIAMKSLKQWTFPYSQTRQSRSI